MPRIFGSGWWSAFLHAFLLRLRSFILGQPLATSVQLEHRLPIVLALPVFASDALSSVAYATEELLIVLAETPFGALNAIAFRVGGLPIAIAISLAIAGLLVIVGISFYQAINLYPSGGGSYSVVRDYLGPIPGMIAASALTIDYILTVAVSVSAGVAALVSTYPEELAPYRVIFALLLVIVITTINLRGTRESGWTFAIPAYTFITMVSLVILASIYHFIFRGVQPIVGVPDPVAIKAGHAFGLFMVLRAFSNGCAAMTGVEAVADGTSAFKPPESKNAGKTLIILISILAFLFLGVGFSATVYHAQPSHAVTIVAQLAEANFGRNPLYWVTIFATLAVLMVASNTAFAGFPRLAAIVARDGYMPKSLARLGDRLVHNTGILALTVFSILLILLYRANVTALIGLYAVGVFLTFTLTQTAVVRRILQVRGPGWQRQLFVGITGALATGIVTVVIAVSKAGQGAWIVLVLIPILVGVSMLIKRHYDWFDRTMSIHDYDYNPLAEPVEPLTVLVLVSSDVHRGIIEGLECGRAIAEGHPNSLLRAVHIEMDPEKTPRLKAKWEQFVEPYLGQKIKLDIIPSPYRWLVEPVLDYLDWTDLERTGDRVIVVLPEFETGSWLTQFLHNFTARRLRTILLNRPHVTVVSSRYFMKPMAWRIGRGGLVY
ncbi:MAG: APC family permease [Armatimonadota bacterium]